MATSTTLGGKQQRVSGWRRTICYCCGTTLACQFSDPVALTRFAPKCLSKITKKNNDRARGRPVLFIALQYKRTTLQDKCTTPRNRAEQLLRDKQERSLRHEKQIMHAAG